jgi:HSP20 family protein
MRAARAPLQRRPAGSERGHAGSCPARTEVDRSQLGASGHFQTRSTGTAVPFPPDRSIAMSMLTRWNPFRSSSSLSLMPEFDDLLRGFGGRSMFRDLDTMPEMRIDLAEDDTSYRAVIDMPGVDKDDIKVSAEGNQITVSADTRRETETRHEKRLVTERYSGHCYRSFSLPLAVDDSRAEAHYDNGVLTLVLPKKSNGSSHRIMVS